MLRQQHAGCSEPQKSKTHKYLLFASNSNLSYICSNIENIGMYLASKWPLLLPFLICCSYVNYSFSFVLRDYFRSSASFSGHLYGKEQQYVVHDLKISISVYDFQWVLLGFFRPCDLKIDQSPTYSGKLSLQGYTSKYTLFPKKRYSVTFESDDGIEHTLNLRSSHTDPSYSREKLFHDSISALNATALIITHVRVYINGEYNGLYEAAETIDSSFMYKYVDGFEKTRLYYNQKPVNEVIAIRTEVSTTAQGKRLSITGKC